MPEYLFWVGLANSRFSIDGTLSRRRAWIAATNRRRWPTEITPRPNRSLGRSSGGTWASISFSGNVCSYCSSPRRLTKLRCSPVPGDTDASTCLGPAMVASLRPLGQGQLGRGQPKRAPSSTSLLIGLCGIDRGVRRAARRTLACAPQCLPAMQG